MTEKPDLGTGVQYVNVSRIRSVSHYDQSVPGFMRPRERKSPVSVTRLHLGGEQHIDLIGVLIEEFMGLLPHEPYGIG